MGNALDSRRLQAQTRGSGFEYLVVKMQVSFFKLYDGADKFGVVPGYFRLRGQVFMGRLGWDLCEVDGFEYEQYDTDLAMYAVAHSGAEVFGGARLIRTDAVQPTAFGGRPYTYMIKDAADGRLDGLPADLCEERPPVSRAVWELTRFASAGKGVKVGEAILGAVNDYLRAQGASSCLFLGPAAFMVMARRMKFQPRPLGPVSGNKDGRFLAFECGVV